MSSPTFMADGSLRLKLPNYSVSDQYTPVFFLNEKSIRLVLEGRVGLPRGEVKVPIDKVRFGTHSVRLGNFVLYIAEEEKRSLEKAVARARGSK